MVMVVLLQTDFCDGYLEVNSWVKLSFNSVQAEREMEIY